MNDKKKLIIIVVSVFVLTIIATLLIIFLTQGNDSNKQVKYNEEKEIIPDNSEFNAMKKYICDVKVTFLDQVKEYYKGINFRVTETYEFIYHPTQKAQSGRVVINYILNSKEDYNKMNIPENGNEVINNEENLTKSVASNVLIDYEKTKDLSLDDYIKYLDSVGINNCKLQED